MKGPGLPDVSAIDRQLGELRLGATLRGVEATVEGVLSREGDSLILRISGTDSAIRLAPLTAKVQWNLDKKRGHPLTRAEKTAFTRLRNQRVGERVEVVGPLDMRAGADASSLQVRSYRILKQGAP